MKSLGWNVLKRLLSSANTWTGVQTINSPVISGGTIDNNVVGGVTPAAGSFSSLTLSGLEYMKKGADFTGATVNLATATGNVVDLTTDTTALSTFGTVAAGAIFYIRFLSARTLTYNGTSFILPGSRDIVTESGDRAIFVSLGSGNWACYAYMKGNGRVLGDVIIVSDSSTSNIAADKMRGQFHIVTGAYTLSLPTAVVGYSATFFASTAAAFSLDVVTGTDVIILNGTALTAGYKATSDGTINASCDVTCAVAGKYIITSTCGLFVDGGA